MTNPYGGRDGWLPIHAGGLIVAALSAPGLAFLMHALATGVSGGLGQSSSFLEGLGAVLLALAFVTVWGLAPSAVFGGAGAWILESRLGRGPRPVWAFVLAGACASTAYVALSCLLDQVSSGAAFLIAPWITELRTTQSGLNGPLILLASLFASGPVAALIYARVSRGWAARSATPTDRREPAPT